MTLSMRPDVSFKPNIRTQATHKCLQFVLGRMQDYDYYRKYYESFEAANEEGYRLDQNIN